jgi:hypothetical protein
VEGTAFFAKSHCFKLVLANWVFFQRLGFGSEVDLGRGDYFELVPKLGISPTVSKSDCLRMEAW